MRYRTRLLVLLLSAPILAFAVLGGYLGRTFAQEDSYRPLRIFEDVVSLILNSYVEDVDVDLVMAGAMRGLSGGLDADSAYLTPGDVAALESGDALPEGRTGVTLTRQFYLRVLSARDGSPAAEAGLRPGDYIRGIDGESTRSMSIFEGTQRLRGAIGSAVTLTVIRGNATEPQEIALTRARLTAASITARLAAPAVGYVRVAAFDAGVADEIRDTVGSLEEAGAQALVVDLRGTADGSNADGVDAARLFVGTGTLAIRQRRDESQETTVAESGDGDIDLPTVLLIGNGTSGAAELFASALADNARAELIGGRTFGRAAEQRLIKLPDGSGLWLSWAQYLTAGGERLHQQGLEPAIVVPTPSVEMGAEPPDDDPALDRAIERLTTEAAAA
jgi:carboxyl-terminal processing protease